MNNDSLLFPIADALQVDLSVAADGSFTAEGNLKALIGPWEVPGLKLTGHSVSRSPTPVTQQAEALIHIKKDLWAYVVSKPTSLRIILLSGPRAGLKMPKDRLSGDVPAKVKQAAEAYFSYSLSNRKWTPTDAFDLD